MDEIKDLLTTIIKNIVRKPEEVSMTISEGTDEEGEVVMIYVKVGKEDIGRCIGEAGKNAEALRKVVALIAWNKLNKRVRTRIEAPKKSFAYEQ